MFQSRKAPTKGEVDSEEENDMLDKMDEVQQIVEDFHDLLVPEALEYYLGLNEDFDMLGMDEGGESGNSDNDDNSDGSGDGGDKKKKDKKEPKTEQTAEGDQKQECKQQ